MQCSGCFVVAVVDTRDDVLAIDSECLDSIDRKSILPIDDDPFILAALETLLSLLGR